MSTEPKDKTATTGNASYPAGHTGNRIAPDPSDMGNKEYDTLRALLALRGHTLHRTSPSDGPVCYYAERWGQVRFLPTFEDARQFLVQIGGAA